MSSEKGNARSTLPKAVVHKKILDAAASNPAASVEELTDEVAGASVALVERVLDEYGDPAADDDAAGDDAEDGPDAADGPDTADESGDPTPQPEMGESTTDQPADSPVPSDGADGDQAAGTESGPTGDADAAATTTESEAAAADGSGAGTEGDMSDSSTTPNADATVELTDKQRRILERIREHPEATQQDLAERFDVSQATISNHLNAISGFEWSDRRAFAERVLDDEPTDEAPSGDGATGGGDATAGDDASASGGDGPAPRTVAQSDAAVETPTPVEGERDAVAARVDRIDERLDDRADAHGALAADVDELGESVDALGEDLDSLDDALDSLDDDLDGLDDWLERLDRLEARFDEVEERFDRHAERLERYDELADAVERVDARLDDVATAVEDLEDRPATDGAGDELSRIDAGGTVAFGDAALASKVMRACLNDDDITEEEEVEILECIVTGDD